MPPPGLEIEIVKFQLTLHECNGSELKKWINLCNIFYIMGERHIQGFGGENLMGKRPLGRPRRRWEDNIKVDIHEVGCGGVDLD